jgi:hypothetical protein
MFKHQSKIDTLIKEFRTVIDEIIADIDGGK